MLRLALWSTTCLCVFACREPLATPLPELSAVPEIEARLTSAEAYASIPHRRTEINFTDSTLPDEHRRYVELALLCLDRAIALRVSTLQDVVSGKTGLDDYTREQDRLIGFLKGLTPPEPVAAYHKAILVALSHQREFFLAWSGRHEDIRSHPSVRGSSAALHEAYSLLKNTVSSQAPGNDDAIFDYHCALDFI